MLPFIWMPETERTEVVRWIAGNPGPRQMRIVRNGIIFNITANAVNFVEDDEDVDDDNDGNYNDSVDADYEF